MLLRRCIFCLAENAMEMKYDKFSRPMVYCVVCNTRAFLKRIEAVRGLAVVPDLIDGALKVRDANATYAAKFDGCITSLMGEVRQAGTVAPAPREKVSGLPSQASPVPFVLVK